jgi:hypothetical protein
MTSYDVYGFGASSVCWVLEAISESKDECRRFPLSGELLEMNPGLYSPLPSHSQVNSTSFEDHAT